MSRARCGRGVQVDASQRSAVSGIRGETHTQPHMAPYPFDVRSKSEAIWRACMPGADQGGLRRRAGHGAAIFSDPCILDQLAKIRSLAFSATAMVAALIMACGIAGNTEASMTRRPAIP